MSYSAREISDYTGQPLELYRFVQGDSVYLYTSADEQIAWSEEEIYLPIYIKRGSFTKGSDSHKSTLEIEVRPDNAIAQMFRSGWITGQVVVTIYRLHRSDTERTVMWKGRIISCKWEGDVATLSSDNASTLFQHAALRRIYQVGCPHVLYSEHCGIAAANWKVTGTVVAVSENRIQLGGNAASCPDGYLKGGMIQVGSEMRLIITHAEGWITLVDGLDLADGEGIDLWPGCAHNVSSCRSKFGNLINYGGLPFLPEKNPFSGDALV